MTDERISEINNYVYAKVWKLNASGEFDKVARLFVDVENTRPEWPAEKVGQKYIDYFNKWMTENEGTEERFIAKEKKLVSIYEFIVTRKYHEEFNIIRKGRDFYLFGDETHESLKASLYVFVNSISHGRK